MVVLLMELLSSRMGCGDPMAADKGFAAWSLLTRDVGARRSAGAALLEEGAGAAAGAAGCAAEAATATVFFFLSAGEDLAGAAAVLTAGVLGDACLDAVF
jgi:hypothetical protein